MSNNNNKKPWEEPFEEITTESVSRHYGKPGLAANCFAKYSIDKTTGENKISITLTKTWNFEDAIALLKIGIDHLIEHHELVKDKMIKTQ